MELWFSKAYAPETLLSIVDQDSQPCETIFIPSNLHLGDQTAEADLRLLLLFV